MFLMFLLTMKTINRKLLLKQINQLFDDTSTGVNDTVNKEHACEINLMKRGK